MLQRIKLRILLQGLILVLLSPAHEATSLGLTVHAVPLESDGGNTMRAHFSVITPSPCPDFSSVCAPGEDCMAHLSSVPFTGTKPSPDWCVRQWQKTVPSDYKAELSLGPRTKFYVRVKAKPKIRANSGKLNQPPFVALPPPLRARAKCPHHFHLSVKDLDGDRVKCRFASANIEECIDCNQHPFIELNEEKCTLSFTGEAAPGQYSIYLMAEDLIPVPKISQFFDNTPLSSVPVHLSLTVEESSSSCSAEPVVTEETPEEDSVKFVLPFQQVKFNVNYKSELESVSEVAVVGPPDLYRVGFTSVGSLATITMAWIRSENNLTHLLPVCFVANTKSLQSDLRCVWLYQREMKTLPAGTELTCGKTEMTLVLPVTSLTNIDLAELQLNSPTCPVTYNTTHLTARISLTGCGTKRVQSGSELVYTNTLQSVRPYTMVSRQPSLVLPLACRIPGAQVKGPQYAVNIPSERETFGQIRVWIEFHFPGKGPLAKFTAVPRFRTNLIPFGRARRQVESITGKNSTTADDDTATGEIGSKIKELDLYILSNCSVERAEMVVTDCVESETEDMADPHPIMDKGCLTSNNTFEIVTSQSNSKIYRIDLSTTATSGSTMYVECKVRLCITTMPSDKCPDVCSRAINQRALVNSVFTSTYTVRSGPVSLVVTPPPPTTTTGSQTTTTPATATTSTMPTPSTTITTPAATTTTPVTTTGTTTSHAPGMGTSMTMGVILTTFRIFLQKIILY